jgi:hypothetical protein
MPPTGTPFRRKILAGAEVYFDAPRRSEPVPGEIVRVGYPAIEIEPARPLEAIDGRPIERVIRAVWDVQIARLGRARLEDGGA